MPHFTTSDGLRLAYEDTGTGTPVLCLSGLTRNMRDFDFLAPFLSGYRMIAMDYRGRGQSDHDPNHANYAVPREALDAVELLDHLGVERCHVIGTSRGGLIAMVLAATVPHRLAGVVLNDVGPVVDPGGIARIMEYVGKPPAAPDLDAAAVRLEASMRAEFPGVSLERWRRMVGNFYEETGGGLALRYDPALRQALLDQAAAGPIPDLWPLFEALKDVPTGVVRGANSDVLTAETLAEMARRREGLVLGVVPDRGHAPFLDEPEALTVIRAVLES